MPCHHERPDDPTILKLDRLNENSPGHAGDHTRKGRDRVLGSQQTDDTLADMHERVLIARSGPRFSIESRYRLIETADDLNDFRAGYDLRDCLDYETSLQARYAGETVV